LPATYYYRQAAPSLFNALVPNGGGDNEGLAWANLRDGQKALRRRGLNAAVTDGSKGGVGRYGCGAATAYGQIAAIVLSALTFLSVRCVGAKPL